MKDSGFFGRLFGRSALSGEDFDAAFELFLNSGLGVEGAELLLEVIKRAPKREELRERLSSALLEWLRPVEPQKDFENSLPDKGTILFIGVNGVGKTSSIGKLAFRLQSQGKTPLLGAGDTFRAAAVDQLELWGKRLGVEVVSNRVTQSPSAVAYDAVTKLHKTDVDLLLLDTAGRLSNKEELKEELSKIVRVIQKQDPKAPAHIWLVLDAQSGLNALSQVEAFSALLPVSGLIYTKVEQAQRGGILIRIAQKFKIPIQYLTFGENPQDMAPFSAEVFANRFIEALLGPEDEHA